MRTSLNKESISKAIAAVESVGIVNNGTVPKQFTGYIASFGAAMIQSGLLPAVVFFADPEADAEEDRHLLIEAIEQYCDYPETLSAYLLAVDKNELPQIENDVLEAAQAIKLALRTFKKSDS